MELFRSEFDPIDALLALQRELERTLSSPPRFEMGVSRRGVFPPWNVFVDKDDYVLRLELPDVAPGDVNIEARGRTLSISGKRQPKVPEGGSYHRSERPRVPARPAASRAAIAVTPRAGAGGSTRYGKSRLPSPQPRNARLAADAGVGLGMAGHAPGQGVTL